MSNSNWFKDLFIDEAKSALNGRSGDISTENVATGDDALELVAELGTVTPIASASRSLYADTSGNIYIL